MGEISFEEIILSDEAIEAVENVKEKLSGLSRLINSRGKQEIWAELGTDGALMVKGKIDGSTIKIKLEIPYNDWGMIAD